MAHLEIKIELNALEESDDPWQQRLLPLPSRRAVSLMDYHPTSSATTARKRAIWSKTVSNLIRKRRRMPKRAIQLKRRHISKVSKLTTLRNDVGKVQVCIIGNRSAYSSVNNPDSKEKHYTITPHRPNSNPH